MTKSDIKLVAECESFRSCLTKHETRALEITRNLLPVEDLEQTREVGASMFSGDG